MPVSNFTIGAFTDPKNMDTLDYWTRIAIEAHFKELVLEAINIDNTGSEKQDETGITGETV
jgi:hypothetical protein